MLASVWVVLILLAEVWVVLDLAWPAGLVTLAYYWVGSIMGLA